MSEKVAKIVRKIGKMRAYHSDDDIRAAMRQILKNGFPEKAGDGSANHAAKGKPESKSAKPLSEGVSRAVLEIEESDPEKFEMLSYFDRLLRKSDVLTNMRALREFGQSLDKSFEPGKSRRDAVPRLVQLMANMPIDRLATVIESALERERTRGDADDDYQRLANFLMTKRN